MLEIIGQRLGFLLNFIPHAKLYKKNPGLRIIFWLVAFTTKSLVLHPNPASKHTIYSSAFMEPYRSIPH